MAPRRRARGDGSVCWNEARQRWEGLLDLDLGPGRQRLEAGDVAPRTMTVADPVDQWIDSVPPTLAPNTARRSDGPQSAPGPTSTPTGSPSCAPITSKRS